MDTALATLDTTTGRDPMPATIHALGFAVATATDPAWLKSTRDCLAAFATVLKRRAGARDQQYAAAEMKLRAERRLGEMLAQTPLDKGGRPPKRKTANATLSVRLVDLGITPMQSSRWQTEASVPEHEFIKWMDDLRARDEDITSAGLRELAMNLRGGSRRPAGAQFPIANTATPTPACPGCGHVFECDL